MKLTTLAAYLFCLAAGTMLARFELHTDDAGVVVFFILAITLLLGCWHPRHAWQWALLVGPWVPAADLCKWFFAAPRPNPGSLAGVAMLVEVVILVGLVGSYAGVVVRRAIARAVGHSG